MADPLSATASVIGITGAAIQSVRVLANYITAIKDAPEAITDLKDDLTALEAVLLALEETFKIPSLKISEVNVQPAIRLAVDSCKRACDKFHMKLARWTKYSTESKIHWWDRVRVGLFAEADVAALSEQLNKCKQTLNAAVSTASLLATAEQPTNSAKSARNILKAKEMELAKSIAETHEHTKEVTTKMQHLSTLDRGNDEVETKVLRIEAIEQLKDEQDTFIASQEVLEALLSEAHHRRTGQRISNVDMSDGGQLLVGLINTEAQDGNPVQDIHGITANRGGMGIVGVASGVDVNSFFQPMKM